MEKDDVNETMEKEDGTNDGKKEVSKLETLSEINNLLDPADLSSVDNDTLKNILNLLKEKKKNNSTEEGKEKTKHLLENEEKVSEIFKNNRNTDLTNGSDQETKTDEEVSHCSDWAIDIEKEDRDRMLSGTMLESELLLHEIPDELHELLNNLINRKNDLKLMNEKLNEKIIEAKSLVKADESTAKLAEEWIKEFNSLKEKIGNIGMELRKIRRYVNKVEMKKLIGRKLELSKSMDELQEKLNLITEKSIPKMSVKEDLRKLSSVVFDPIKLTSFSTPGIYTFVKEVNKTIEECGMAQSRTALNKVSQTLKINNFDLVERILHEKTPSTVEDLFKHLFNNYGKPLYVENLLIERLESLGVILPKPTNIIQRDENLTKALTRDSVLLQYSQSVQYIEKYMGANPQYNLNTGLQTSRMLNAILSSFDKDSLYEIMVFLQKENNLSIHKKIMYVQEIHQKQLCNLELLKHDYSCLEIMNHEKETTIRNIKREQTKDDAETQQMEDWDWDDMEDYY